MRILVPLIIAAGLFPACSSSNNLLLGRVKSRVGKHDVVVTDCYRTSVPQPEMTGPSDYRWAPCKDSVIVIHGDELSVNGQPYGRLGSGDAVIVDHGKVSVEKRA